MMKAGLAIIGTATLLTACSVRDEDEGTDSTLTTPEPSASASNSASASDRAGEGEAMALDITQTHPAGVTISLESIEARPNETVLTMRMENTSNNDRQLNFGSNGTYIFGPDGAKLMLEAPSANENLALPPGQALQADLVFSGMLVDGGPATLIINNGRELEDENIFYPGFRIPIPLEDAAFSDVASSGSSSRLRLLAATPIPSAGTSKSTISAIRTELGARETQRGILVALPGDVLFDFDKADIKPAARPTLDKLARLVAASDTEVAIEGHTDSKGDEAYNLKLSERRARAVRDYLKDVRSVSAERMNVQGYGEDRPVAQNMTPDGSENQQGMQKNRRVEVIIDKA